MMKEVFKVIIQTFIKSNWKPMIQMEYDDKYPRIFLSCFFFEPRLKRNLITSLVNYFEFSEEDAENRYDHSVQVCLDKIGFAFTNYYFDQKCLIIDNIATRDLKVMISDYDKSHDKSVCDLFVSELFQFLNYNNKGGNYNGYE